jgi:hypothetical protein
MAEKEFDESWTLPFHIVIRTTLVLGVIAVMVVFLLD